MSRIILKRLIIQGISYRRTLHFNEGLTIISGEKTSGKSLVLSLIDYCLGRKTKIDLTVQPELDAHCDQVFLELKINDEILTLGRPLKEKQTKISIYFCAFENLDEYTPKTLSVKEAMQLLMQKLNINEYKIIRYQKHSNKKEIDTVSFRDIFRYVYIHQHALGTDDFLEKKNIFKSNKNSHAFKMMFNLIDVDRDALSEQLVKVQNEIEQTRKDISGLNSYLKDLDAEDRITLQAASEKFNNNITKHKSEKINIIQRSKVINNKSNENAMYMKLKKHLESLSNEIFDYQHKKRHLQMSISSKKLLLEEYGIEKQEIKETLDLNYELVIPEQSVECPICNSKVTPLSHEQNNKDINTMKMLNKVEKEIDGKINLVTRLIEQENKKIEEYDKHIVDLSRKQSIFTEALSEYSKETDVPFLSELDSINSIINRLIKEHESIKEGLRIHHKIDEKNKHIDDLEAAEIRLNKEISQLQINGEKKKQIFHFLDSEYRKFMERLKYNTTTDTYIHQEKFIPFYNGASVYVHESGGLLECMQLSYLGALLKSKTMGYAAGHPGLLLLDSLSKYVGTLKTRKIEKSTTAQEEGKDKINDPEVYEEFYKILIELSVNHQIILVENTPPEQFDNIYTKYTFYEGEKGLINEEMNELKDSDGL